MFLLPISNSWFESILWISWRKFRSCLMRRVYFNQTRESFVSGVYWWELINVLKSRFVRIPFNVEQGDSLPHSRELDIGLMMILDRKAWHVMICRPVYICIEKFHCLPLMFMIEVVCNQSLISRITLQIGLLNKWRLTFSSMRTDASIVPWRELERMLNRSLITWTYYHLV